ncbi:MAG: Dabb family protein [Ruminococcus sp.]|nr:Dabb family protein [Ruminococcus sp.]
MVKHIVMFKLKNTPDRAEKARLAKAEAEKLQDKVPSLKEYEVVLNAEGADGTNYDIALICLFEDMAGLAEYQQHSEHKKFGAFIGELREDGGRACIDFEV